MLLQDRVVNLSSDQPDRKRWDGLIVAGRDALQLWSMDADKLGNDVSSVMLSLRMSLDSPGLQMLARLLNTPSQVNC